MSIPHPRLRDPRHVHTGSLFEVFRATLDGGDVAVKRHAATPRWDAAVATEWTHSNRTNIFHHRQLGWTDREPPPETSYFDALLRAEHAVIERAASPWNHPGAQLARWRADDAIVPAEADAGEGRLCLVMPWCDGDSFASLARAEQRRWLPAMLPALWRALSACPHGDLAPGNLMLDRERGVLRILDPGVRITGPSRPGSLDFSSELLTTNAAQYPLILPEHGPERPRVCAPGGGLSRIVGGYASSLFDQAMRTVAVAGAPALAPAAADVVACGAIYFGVLAGIPLISLLGIEQPLWTGFWSSRGDHPPRHPGIDALAAGAISVALRSTGATAAEIALCERLVTLDLDGEALARCIADVTGSTGAL